MREISWQKPQNINSAFPFQKLDKDIIINIELLALVLFTSNTAKTFVN